MLPEGMSKAEAIARLYNRSQPLGTGFLHYDPKPMTITEAEEYTKFPYLDYLKGRVMKVSLEEWDFRLYDRDNGPGAGLNALTDPMNKPPA